MPLSLTSPIGFSDNRLNFAEDSRSNIDVEGFLSAPHSYCLIFYQGNVLTQTNLQTQGAYTYALCWVHPLKLSSLALSTAKFIFLGIHTTKTGKHEHMFACSLTDEQQMHSLCALLGEQDHAFLNLRAIALDCNPRDLSICGQAAALLDWHHNHAYCGSCGNLTAVAKAGFARHCHACGADAFPRINPVVIMLVIRDDKCLLGRQQQWPEHLFSALAGFVSPGETLEQACMREVKEEVSITVNQPVYKISQPWPFPSQLMIGMFCYTQDKEIIPDMKEISEARWFDKNQLLKSLQINPAQHALHMQKLAKEDESVRKGAILCPPAFTIAHQLIKLWVEESA